MLIIISILYYYIVNKYWIIFILKRYFYMEVAERPSWAVGQPLIWLIVSNRWVIFFQIKLVRRSQRKDLHIPEHMLVVQNKKNNIIPETLEEFQAGVEPWSPLNLLNLEPRFWYRDYENKKSAVSPGMDLAVFPEGTSGSVTGLVVSSMGNCKIIDQRLRWAASFSFFYLQKRK